MSGKYETPPGRTTHNRGSIHLGGSMGRISHPRMHDFGDVLEVGRPPRRRPDVDCSAVSGYVLLLSGCGDGHYDQMLPESPR